MILLADYGGGDLRSHRINSGFGDLLFYKHSEGVRRRGNYRPGGVSYRRGGVRGCVGAWVTLMFFPPPPFFFIFRRLFHLASPNLL